MVDISVITNCHNEGRLLRPTLKSVNTCIQEARAKNITVEWIIVRDNPDESTLEHFDNFGPPEAQIFDVDFKDLGLARNYGVTKASGHYITFVDGDDIWSKNWLKAAYANAESLQDKNIILHPEMHISFDAQQCIMNFYHSSHQNYNPDILLFWDYWSVSCFANREIFLKYPYPSNDLKTGFGFEDWHWNCETIASGIRHDVIHGTFFCHRDKSWQKSLYLSQHTQKSIMYPTKLGKLAYQKKEMVPSI